MAFVPRCLVCGRVAARTRAWGHTRRRVLPNRDTGVAAKLRPRLRLPSDAGRGSRAYSWLSVSPCVEESSSGDCHLGCESHPVCRAARDPTLPTGLTRVATVQ